MPVLNKVISKSVERAGVQTVKIDKAIAKMWDKDKGLNDPPTYCGWYWHQTQKGRIIAHDNKGPFPCSSAAVADAYKSLQLRPYRG